MKLQYRSKRRGFHFYVQGQVKWFEEHCIGYLSKFCVGKTNFLLIEKCTSLFYFKVKEVSDKFYDTKVDMKMEKQEVVFDTVVTTFHMKFENTVYTKAQEALSKLKENSMPIRASVLFEMFPFCILFTVNEYQFIKN